MSIEILSKADFVEQINKIKKVFQDEDLFLEVTGIAPERSQFICAYHDIVDGYIDMLARAVGDKDEWVCWYVWETKWGTQCTEVVVRGKDYLVTDAGALYDVIMIDADGESIPLVKAKTKIVAKKKGKR
jgi:hypothetical protein